MCSATRVFVDASCVPIPRAGAPGQGEEILLFAFGICDVVFLFVAQLWCRNQPEGRQLPDGVWDLERVAAEVVC